MKVFFLIAMMVLVCGSSPAGLVVHYAFDEGERAVSPDLSGNGYDAEPVEGFTKGRWTAESVPAGTYGAITITKETARDFGAALRTAGNNRKLMKVNAAGSKAMNGLIASGKGTATAEGEMTVMAWVWLYSSTGPQSIVVSAGPGGSYGWRMLMWNGFLSMHSLGVENGKGEVVQKAKQWMHCAVTLKDGQMEFFVNGESIGKGAWEKPFRDERAGGRVLIGGSPGGVAWLKGNIDELKIFDEVLSVEEIRAAALPGKESAKSELEDGVILIPVDG